jgi:hypothetical protein
VFKLEAITTGSRPAAAPRLKVVVPAAGTHKIAAAR